MCFVGPKGITLIVAEAITSNQQTRAEDELTFPSKNIVLRTLNWFFEPTVIDFLPRNLVTSTISECAAIASFVAFKSAGLSSGFVLRNGDSSTNGRVLWGAKLLSGYDQKNPGGQTKQEQGKKLHLN